MNSNPDPQADPAPVAELAQRLGLPFSNLHLLTRALTHRSYVNENPRALEDNERLEFLGDAVLDFVVGAWVYHHFPEMAEGELTRLRSALVKTDQLARFARALDLGPALRLGRGELTSGGRDRENLLCGAFEAIIGALYLEAGISFVEQFMLPLLESARAEIFAQTDLADAKSRLQEWIQGQKLGALRYATVSTSGPDHAKRFEVEVRVDGRPLGRGQGSSKAAAEQEAARAALKALGLE
jgi:ribonuclease-3